MRLWFIASVLCAESLQGQTDPRDILLNARHKIMESVKRLPRYMCTETVERDQFTTGHRRHLSACDEPAKAHEQRILQIRDRLRLDVAISPDREIFAWHGSPRFDDRDLLDIVNEGALSTGEFGGHLSNLFGSSAATFTYNGDRENEHGRTIAEFGFSVPKERSLFEFGNRHFHTMTAYDGTMLVDTRTLEVLQIVIRTARLPEETGACQATMTLDLGSVPINAYDLTLPAAAKFSLVMLDGSERENRARYSSCREFHATSNLTFDDAEPAGGPAAKPPEKPLSVPPLDLVPDTPFRLKLMQDIDPANAAAGDEVLLTVAASINDSRSVPVLAGALVHGRIMRIQNTYGGRPAASVTIRLESIEAMGKTRPFSGQGELPAQRFNVGPVSGVRRRAELGSLDQMEQRDTAELTELRPAANFVFGAGTEMKWLYLRPASRR